MRESKRLNAEQRKPAILKAFYQVIAAEGFENASVAKVAKQTGVHASLVIHYFGSKERMVLELVDDVLQTYSDLICKLPNSGEPHERLEQLLVMIWSREWHEAASFSVVFSFLALSQRDAGVMDRVRALYESYMRYLRVQVKFFAEADVIRVTDPEAAAQGLHLPIHGQQQILYGLGFLIQAKVYFELSLSVKQSLQVYQVTLMVLFYCQFCVVVVLLSSCFIFYSLNIYFFSVSMALY